MEDREGVIPWITPDVGPDEGLFLHRKHAGFNIKE